MVVVFILVFVLYPVVGGKVRMKENVNYSNVLLYFLLGLVPFLRFLVMHNHSIIHSFFTHRALAATVMAICFMVFEIIERNPEYTAHRKAVTEDA